MVSPFFHAFALQSFVKGEGMELQLEKMKTLVPRSYSLVSNCLFQCCTWTWVLVQISLWKVCIDNSFFPHHVLNWKCFIADGLILSSSLAVYGIIFRWFLSQGLLRNFFVPGWSCLAKLVMIFPHQGAVSLWITIGSKILFEITLEVLL